MSLFILPKTGEPRHLVKSYWDKDKKKHSSKKIAYVFKWPEKAIDRLKRLQKRLDQQEKRNAAPDLPKSYIQKGLRLAEHWRNRIRDFKHATNREVARKRERVDRRFTGTKNARPIQKLRAPPNPLNELKTILNSSRLKDILARLRVDRNYCPGGRLRDDLRGPLAAELKDTKDLLAELWQELGIELQA
jgi:hypothetical protein